MNPSRNLLDLVLVLLKDTHMILPVLKRGRVTLDRMGVQKFMFQPPKTKINQSSRFITYYILHHTPLKYNHKSNTARVKSQRFQNDSEWTIQWDVLSLPFLHLKWSWLNKKWWKKQNQILPIPCWTVLTRVCEKSEWYIWSHVMYFFVSDNLFLFTIVWSLGR